MKCEVFNTPIGPAIVCSRGQRRPKACVYCGRPSDRLCDEIVDPDARKTCDAPMCIACVPESRGGLDFCRDHAAACR